MIPVVGVVIALAAFFIVYTINGGASVVNIATVAQNAGFTGDDLVMAVAIALAESGGNAHAYNPETAAGAPTGKGSFGLWQIYLHAHPEYEGVDLYDPQANANAAFAIYANAGHAFSPWSTFKNGAYTAQLTRAAADISSATSALDA